VEKVALKICATSVNFKTLSKVNNRPMGENAPNLVTLLVREERMRDKKVFFYFHFFRV
jgi:hypothetical protein